MWRCRVGGPGEPRQERLNESMFRYSLLALMTWVVVAGIMVGLNLEPRQLSELGSLKARYILRMYGFPLPAVIFETEWATTRPDEKFSGTRIQVPFLILDAIIGMGLPVLCGVGVEVIVRRRYHRKSAGGVGK